MIVYGLWRSRTGWSNTDRLVNKLLKWVHLLTSYIVLADASHSRLSVETQLPGTVVAIGFMLNFGIDTSSLLNAFWELFHPKIYVVCLLGESAQHL